MRGRFRGLSRKFFNKYKPSKTDKINFKKTRNRSTSSESKPTKSQHELVVLSETDPNEMIDFLKNTSPVDFHTSPENKSFFNPKTRNHNSQRIFSSFLNQDELSLDQLCTVIDREIFKIEENSKSRAGHHKYESRFKENIDSDEPKQVKDPMKNKFKKDEDFIVTDKDPKHTNLNSEDILIPKGPSRNDTMQTITKNIQKSGDDFFNFQTNNVVVENEFKHIKFSDDWEPFYYINEFPTTPQRFGFYDKSFENVRFDDLDRANVSDGYLDTLEVAKLRYYKNKKN
ncbi:hypothetical protein KGF54_004729 [Candida jiufengensis]|uniref:uncharacterized protein n=1 Tax=Candida jiufengensis TaxID=497108 RepID=UPI00222504DC|nr:uncharacterized protein KGF54_004729 [Candida jiufengensis]KAI5951654.1 hypothetical protein KGF54_004729 [Candida jiufengensis]